MMNKTLVYTAILILLIGIVFFYFWGEALNSEEVLPENVLVGVEDVSGTDFYVRYQETSGTEFYIVPASENYVSTKVINLVGDYNKDEEKEMLLSSRITRFVNDATPQFEYTKEFILDHTKDWQNEEEFTPNFNGSSYFQYKRCIQGTRADNTETYMCVVSSTVKQDYLFVLLLRGSGLVMNEQLEALVESALTGKQNILESLP
jgi:hypothetical protein